MAQKRKYRGYSRNEDGLSSSYSYTNRRHEGGSEEVSPSSKRDRSLLGSDVSDYSRRSSSVNDYARQRRKRQRKRHLITGILIAVIAVIVAGVAGAWAYVNSVNVSLHKGLGEGFEGVLSEPANSGDPYYVLFMGTDGREGEDVYRSDTIILARIDPKEKTATLVSIPRDTRLMMGEHGYQKINAAHAFGGAAYAVQVVENFTGVDISHYVEIDFEGFAAAVDAIGGVEVDVPKLIDDPDAWVYLEPGVQVLNGDQALGFCRSRKFANGDYQRQTDQRIFLKALASQLLSSDKATLSKAVEAMSGYITTDMNVGDIIAAASAMRGMDAENGIYSTDAEEWSEPKTISGISYIIVDEEKFAKVMELVKAGKNPLLNNGGANSAVTSTDPTQYKITVRNGSGVAGCAAEAADKLSSAGYGIESTGNTDQFVYDETLVIYSTESQKAAATDVVAHLGVGRVVESAGRYTFSGDILVVVGKDWPA